jgi:SIR2-like domain/CHAT domain
MSTPNTPQGAPHPANDSPAHRIPLPELLVRQLREGRMVLFAGAGLSAQAGLPSWRALLKDVVDATVAEAMADDAARTELERMLADGKLLQIADHCKDKLGPGGYTQLLAERLADAAHAVPEVHRLAVRLPFAAWVTTNYDKLLERAYAQERGGLPKTLTNRDTEALGRLLFDGAPFILKAHGDLDKPDSLVFTSRDYRDLIHGNAAFSAAFAAILVTHSVLFVGYSLADPDFNLLMDRQLLTFRGFVPERYALMSGLGEVEKEYLWRVCQIRVIPYPEGKHDFVPRFFQALADRLGAEKQAAVAAAVVAAAAAAVLPAEPELASRSFSVPTEPEPPPGPAPAAPAAAQPPTARAPQTPPLTISLAWKGGAVRATLAEGEQSLAGPVAGPVGKWNATVVAFRAAQSGTGSGPARIAACGAALGEMVGEELLRSLAAHIKKRAERVLELKLTRELECLPWELLAVGTRTLAEIAPVFRTPVGVSPEARGLPACNSPLRALVIGDTGAGGELSLPGAAAEAEDVARAIESDGHGEVELLIGAAASFEAVRRAFEKQQPDIVHFAGHAWFDDHEAFLMLADREHATASMLRPWLTVAPPTFVFFNSHYTAFIPPGVETDASIPDEVAIRSGPGGRAGFADIAMRSGVGAFLGSFSGSISDEGARSFAISVYRELLRGASAAAAVQRARQARAAKEDVTRLLFALHGEGSLRLPVAGRS